MSMFSSEIWNNMFDKIQILSQESFLLLNLWDESVCQGKEEKSCVQDASEPVFKNSELAI